MLLSISAIPQLRSTHSAKQTTFPLRKSQKIFPFNECMTEPGSYFMPIWTCISLLTIAFQPLTGRWRTKGCGGGPQPWCRKAWVIYWHRASEYQNPMSTKSEYPNLDSFYLWSTGYRDDARSQGWTTVSCCCLTINWWFHMTMPLF